MFRSSSHPSKSQGFLKRRFRKQRVQLQKQAMAAEGAAEQYFFRRLDRLGAVRRFVIGWLLLLALLAGCLVGQIRALDGYFQTLQPVPGGIYTEGILGDFTNASPLYANNPVDETVSKLIFAGLFKYNDDNKLVGDLAESFTVDDTSRVYTVKLKPNLKWQDGASLTSRDVVFTYQMIQNPDSLSVLNKSWQGIAVAAVDDTTVTFTLPSILGSFPYNMTNGLIPQHILKDVTPAEMRSVGFNTSEPVGAGPFMWQNIEVSGSTPEVRLSKIALSPSPLYHAGKPKLASFVVHAYRDAGQLAVGFKNQELTASSFPNPPKQVKALPSVQTNDFMMSAANMVFFKHSNPILAEAAVRKSLVQSVNVPQIVDDLGYATRRVRGPFLVGQESSDKSLAQPDYDMAAAEAALDAAGWLKGSDASGLRTKAGKPLRFTLYGQDLPESLKVAGQIAEDWKQVGVQAEVRLLNSEDLQRAITNHDYDALLYGISIGVDPDVFVYWHSSQNDPRTNRLNFSEFNSKIADTALEAGRTRIDNQLRAVKYKPFLQAWHQDTPALGLYQPRYLYLTHGTVYGLQPHTLNTETDRFSNVHNWQIRQAATTNAQ